MSVSLTNPVYRRDTPLPPGYLESVGLRSGSGIAEFYEAHDGPFNSRNTGFTLLALGDPSSSESVEHATGAARAKFGWPEHFLVISDLLANAVLVYDTSSDKVFDVDFEGGEAMLTAGTLSPYFASFHAFLEWYFRDECKQFIHAVVGPQRGLD